MNDSQLLLFAVGVLVAAYVYTQWDRRAPRRTTIMRTLDQPVRHDPETGCYEPFCVSAFKGATAAPAEGQELRTRTQERARLYYHNRVDLEHMRAHTSPLYSGDVAGSAGAVTAVVEREVNASNAPGTTMAPLVYMREDDYANPSSTRPGMLCRDC